MKINKQFWKKRFIIGLIYPSLILILTILSYIPFIGDAFYFFLIIIRYPLRLLSTFLSYGYIKLVYGKEYLLRNQVLENFCFNFFNCNNDCYDTFVFCDTLVLLILSWVVGIILGITINYLIQKYK